VTVINLRDNTENYKEVLYYPAGVKGFATPEEADAEWREHIARHRQRVPQLEQQLMARETRYTPPSYAYDHQAYLKSIAEGGGGYPPDFLRLVWRATIVATDRGVGADSLSAAVGDDEPQIKTNTPTAPAPIIFDDDIREEIRREDREANPIKLIPYAEMVALPKGEFLIFGVIVRRAKNVLFGVSNSFKSFMATDMGGSVSTGRTYHGMAVKKCPVIYVANEGANAVGRKRIPAWMAFHKIPQAQRGNIYLVNVETILPNETSRNNLLAAIRTTVEPGEEFFLIIDVLRGTMRGSDSDDEAAAAWTSAAEILVKEGATLLTVTHSPYSDEGRIRGSTHLWGRLRGPASRGRGQGKALGRFHGRPLQGS
jgi:hypothetical protein